MALISVSLARQQLTLPHHRYGGSASRGVSVNPLLCSYAAVG